MGGQRLSECDGVKKEKKKTRGATFRTKDKETYTRKDRSVFMIVTEALCTGLLSSLPIKGKSQLCRGKPAEIFHILT